MSSNWVADEDLDEIEDELFDDDGFNDEVAETPTSDDEAIGTPLPYLDQEVAEELISESPPTWLGTRWRDIPKADQADAWNGLRTWVDWLIREYRLPTAVVPPCWYKHPDITAELYAAMNMEYKVWEEQEPSLSPMMFWHTNLQQMIHRLRDAVTNAGCVSGGQHRDESPGAHELDYDEADWNQQVTTAHSTEQFDRPDQGVLYVRAGLVDTNGETVAHSEPVGIKHHEADQSPNVEIEYLSTTSHYNTLQVHWSNYSKAHRLTWETSLDGQTWEQHEPKGTR
ncbi:MAG: hypothetical protein HLX51_01845 [Micrococcaceae bacterium]|nr:hypothetical protein [Micrococcaceae bacterium]